jgi:hypothetical protein
VEPHKATDCHAPPAHCCWWLLRPSGHKAQAADATTRQVHCTPLLDWLRVLLHPLHAAPPTTCCSTHYMHLQTQQVHCTPHTPSLPLCMALHVLKKHIPLGDSPTMHSTNAHPLHSSPYPKPPPSLIRCAPAFLNRIPARPCGSCRCTHLAQSCVGGPPCCAHNKHNSTSLLPLLNH